MICARKLLLVAGLLTGATACSSYRYMKDITPELDRSRQEYVVNNPGNRYNDDIAGGRVRTGMSRLQVRVAWGDPDLVENPSGQVGREVWAYQEDEPSRGTAIYRLRFVGELLRSLDIERPGALLPTTAEEPGKRQDRGNASGQQAGKKPGDLR